MQRLAPRLRPLTTAAAPRAVLGPAALRAPHRIWASALSTSSRQASDEQSGGAPQIPDQLAEGGAKGVTGGGTPLENSNPGAVPPPKVENAKVSGPDQKLTEEQQREVDEHNREFDKKHDRAGSAAKDQVDEKFWSGGGTRG